MHFFAASFVFFVAFMRLYGFFEVVPAQKKQADPKQCKRRGRRQQIEDGMTRIGGHQAIERFVKNADTFNFS